MPTNCLRYLVLIAVILLLFGKCGCVKKRVNNKFKRKVDGYDSRLNNLEQKRVVNTTSHDKSRGFFTPGLLSLGKVLNFFPVGGERECQPSEFTVARAGICLNAYDCRQRDGRAAGDCAHGLGVCCVFEVTCGGTAQNNLTYFMSPGFPELWAGSAGATGAAGASGARDCALTVDKTHAGVTQLRIDFVHFTIGQPNRTTGECDDDAMILGEGTNKVVVCGQNHGQHLYYTLSSGSEVREAGDLPSTKSTKLTIRIGASEMPRIWLLRLAQMPLAYSAPHDCRQYFTSNNGTIKTFNFAVNGRHLSGQEYRACVRRNAGFCAVRYAPCDAGAFRIGPAQGAPTVMDPADIEYRPGALGGPGSGFYGPQGSFVPGPTTVRNNVTGEQLADETNVPMQQEQLMPADDAQAQDDEVEGSGADPQIAPVMTEAVAPPSIAARIWSFIWPSWLWGQSARGRTWGWRWSPYAQHYAPDDKLRYYGYGNFGVGLQGFGRQRCADRLTIACENEYFVSSTSYVPGVCDPHHCGDTFCPGVPFQNCRVETSITPFAVSVHFGPPTVKRSPEENIGACLRYTQLPCDG